MIRIATPGDIDSIVELHSRVLGWSINGRLGSDHIHTMYSALFSADDIVAFVVERQKQLKGFLVASTDYKKARSRTRAAIGLRGAARILLGCLPRPADWVDLIETVILVPAVMRKVKLSAELLAWVADPSDTIGRLAAYECMMAVLGELRRRGHQRCLAQVLKTNLGPNKFHLRMGSHMLCSFIRNTVYVVECGDGTGFPAGSHRK